MSTPIFRMIVHAAVLSGLLLVMPVCGLLQGNDSQQRTDSMLRTAVYAASNLQTGSEQQNEEAFLSFRYRGVGDVVVIAMYSDGEIYLPTTELFELLGIYYQTDSKNLRVHGHYLESDRPYEIHFNNRTATLDGEQTDFSIDDMLIDELDFYLSPEVFEEVFGLEFIIDMSGLVLRLQTDETMPVVERLERRRRREQIDRGDRMRELHPKQFERDRSLLAGGFLDYSFTGNVSDQTNNYSYTGSIGAEVLGGDVQGNLFGSWSQTSSSFTTSGLRWRYVFEDQPWLTQARVGQHYTEGPQSRQFRGVHLTNQPIEPRRMLDDFVFQGEAPPESEVELFINNRLVDFQEVDELGNYRFLVPMTYGSSNVQLMIFEPDGTIREQDRRIQVPFSFLPPGEFNYHMSAGRMDTPVFGSTNESDLMSGDFTYGIFNWLTAHAGGEFLTELHQTRPFLYSGVSARIYEQYLMNLDLAPDAYYRLSTSVVYPSSVSWDVGATWFTTEDAFYNPGRSDYELRANFFLPVQLGPVPVNFRISGDRRALDSGSTNRVRGDVGVRMGRINLRGGYRDTYRYTAGNPATTDGRLSGTGTYSMSRSRTVPEWLRGLYFRGQIDYSMRMDQIERIDFQISRSIFRQGRLRVSYGRNFVGDFNTLEASFTFDFNRTRSTTTARSSRNSANLRQNVRGSIGYDDYYNKMIFENRQQVGRSAASVRMFVDRNDSGSFDEGDELIRANAVRLDRSGQTRLHDDGIVRVTQIQQYYHDNMEVNLGSIPNPLLVPVIKDFSFVADPNRFKPMDIPFYMSGVIDGMVLRQRGDDQQGLGGVRVQLRQIDGDHSETMRTFSDGSYYAMEIPPGHYKAWVDTTQQDFLNVDSDPAVRRFELQPLAEGDFLEGLDFVLKDRRTEPVEEEEEEDEAMDEFRQQLTGRAEEAMRLYVESQQAFYDLDFARALDLADESIERFVTGYGLALKGSLLFVRGEREEAERYWNWAVERNPEIVKPEIEMLERMMELEQDNEVDTSDQ